MKNKIISPFLLRAITATCYLEDDTPNLRMEIIPLRDICLRLVLVDMSHTSTLALSSFVPAKTTLRSYEMAMHDI